MAALAGDLKKMMAKSVGSQSFEPWWDHLEDKLLYCFITVGLVSLPMTFFSKTPIVCTPHPRLYDANNNTFQSQKAVNRLFPNTYCTETMMHPFLLYLPFMLLIVPMGLSMIERLFISLYGVDQKMDKFYHLLIKESRNNEEVEKLKRENIKDCHELIQTFKKSNQCYNSYLYRTLLQLAVAFILAATFAFRANDYGIATAFFECNVYGFIYQCIIPNCR
jgi:hypothetical protein